MKCPPIACAAILSLFVATLACGETKKAQDFLDPTALHVVDLTLTRDAWATMQPRTWKPFAGLFAASRPAAAKPPEVTRESPFGYRYTYVRADLACEGLASVSGIGLRFKGNSSFMFAPVVNKPFKVDFNHYDKDARFAGLSAVNLHNNALDPTLMREALSYQFFRDVGVPAPRTSYAIVRLNVPGLYDKKPGGVYTVVEEVDKAFLKAHFGSAKGLLLKPEGCFNLRDMGNEFDRYKAIYRPKTDGTPKTQQALVDLAKLIHRADDATFAREIGNRLDVDAFLRFLAANVLLSNMDSILSTGHNFYLYIHPDTLKAHFVPWDLNLSLGTFDWIGPIADQADLDLMQPNVLANRLIERLLSIETYERAYRAEVARQLAVAFNPEQMGRHIDAMRDVVARAEKQANLPHPPVPPGLSPEVDPKLFVAKRHQSAKAQLAGERGGYLPYFQKGLFGRGQPPERRPPRSPAATASQEKVGAP